MSKPNWTPIVIRLGDIIPWTHNPRMSNKAQAQRLIDSEKKWGQPLPFSVSPSVDGKYQLYDGHQRYSAFLTVYGENHKVAASMCDRELTDAERAELVFTLHAGATGSWDWDKVASFPEATQWGFDADLLKNWNNDANNLKELLNSEQVESADAEPQIEADRFEEVAKKWKTASNQLWKIGNHYVYCGDSLSVESVEKVLQGQEPSLVIADPPYGVSIVANVTVGDGESAKDMIPFGGAKNRRGTVGASKPFGSKAERGSVGAAHVVEVGKYPFIIGDESTETAKQAVALYLNRFDNAYHVWWGANYYIESLMPSSCWLVWNKETTGNFADCELAWSNADMSAKLLTHRWNGMLRDSEREKRWHPTQKPAALAEWCMGFFTEKDDVIIDPFGGAGWSLIGAQNSNRKACVIEKSPEYLAVQIERMATAFPELEIKRLE